MSRRPPDPTASDPTALYPAGPADADQVRWLTPEERAAWIPLLALTTNLPAALDAQLQRDAGLTLFEYSVLGVLSQRPEHTMAMGDLAFLAGGSQSRLSHAAGKLERRGLLRREPHPDNARYTNAVLTDAGLERVTAAAPGHVATARDLVVDAVSPRQLDALRRVATAILDRIEPDGPWRRPPPA